MMLFLMLLKERVRQAEVFPVSVILADSPAQPEPDTGMVRLL